MEITTYHWWLVQVFVAAVAVFVPSLALERFTRDVLPWGIKGLVHAISFRLAMASGGVLGALLFLASMWGAMLLMAVFGVLSGTA